MMSQIRSFQIKLTLSAWLNAEKFAGGQKSDRQKKQVYFNTLAVSAVNNYLQYLGWQTDVINSYSWNRELQTLLDVSDLKLTNGGRIECRPVENDSQQMVISEDAGKDTIVHVAVRLRTNQSCAEILGFVAKPKASAIAIDGLQPIEELAGYLAKYTNTTAFSFAKCKVRPITAREAASTWQTWQSFCQTHPQIANDCDGFAYRTALEDVRKLELENCDYDFLEGRMVKLWELETELQSQTVVLIVESSQKQDEALDITIKICPTGSTGLLPSGLVVDVLDERQEIVLQARVTSDSNAVEFLLEGEPEDTFSIKATFNEAIFTESFMILDM